MQNLIEAHLAKRASQKHGPTTLKICRYWLQCFARFRQHRDLAELQEKDLRAFQEHLLWTPGRSGLLSKNTVYQALHMVRIFLRWSLANGHLVVDITENFRLGHVQPRQESLLTRHQLDAILSGPDPEQPLGLRDLAILGVICELGLLGTACNQLNLGDVNLPGHRLGRHVLSLQLEENLQRYLLKGRPSLLVDPQESALFLTFRGNRIERNMFRLIVLNYHRVTPRTLHKSWTAHREALISRRLPGTTST